jgi:hypothetical protein
MWAKSARDRSPAASQTHFSTLAGAGNFSPRMALPAQVGHGNLPAALVGEVSST